MNNIRWVVERRREGDPKVSPLWPGWHIYRLHGGKNGAITDYDQFPTWEMAYARAQEKALAYADQQARTVTVELPSIEVSPISTGYGTTIDRAEQIPLSTPVPDQWGQRLEAEHGKKGPTIRLEGPYGSIYWCSWDDVKTTALHLLALHYAQERSLNELG